MAILDNPQEDHAGVDAKEHDSSEYRLTNAEHAANEFGDDCDVWLFYVTSASRPNTLLGYKQFIAIGTNLVL